MNRQIVLKSARPARRAANLRSRRGRCGAGEGELLVRHSLDVARPLMRGRMSDRALLREAGRHRRSDDRRDGRRVVKSGNSH